MMWRTPATQAFADALDGRRPAKGEVAELVAVATRLCEIAAETEPTPEFRSSLRTQLMAMSVAVPLVARPARQARQSAGIRRWAIAFAAMVATTFGAGMTAASASTIPGDTLYPVKRVLENSQLAFKYSDSSRGGYLLQLATERLTEVDQLTSIHGSSTELTSETLEAFQQQASLGSDALLRSYLSNDSKADLVTLNRFSTASAHRLADLRGRLSAADLEQAEDVLGGLAAQSIRMCPACEGSLADSALSQPSTITSPTDAPTTTSSSTTSSTAGVAGSTASASTSAEPTATSSSSATATPSANLPEVTPLSSPAPPVKDLVDKTVEPIKNSSLVQELSNKSGKLLNLPSAD